MDKNGFSRQMEDEIVYNQRMHDDGTNLKEKFRCINTSAGCHEGPINGIGVLDNGLVVTSGEDNKIKFWNPMNNDPVAVINESYPVSRILTIEKEKLFYYIVGNKAKSFDYSSGIATVIYEGLSDITCLEQFYNSENKSKSHNDIIALISGLKDGTIELINRVHRKVSLSKAFHSGYEVVAVSGRGDYLVTSGTDNIINVYNLKTTLLERELNIEGIDLSTLTGALKVSEAEKEIIIGDDVVGLTWLSFDIQNASKEHPDITIKPVMRLFSGVSSNPELFGAADNKGIVKIYQRGISDTEEYQGPEIVELRKFKGHKGEVTGVSHFRDGSYITCSVDGSYKIWTSRKDVMKVGRAEGGKASC